ncbi:general odorant-binding protein 57c [Drosophila grimshawi]|uniref:GH20839 n=1 Tax=Drosophila grimshawi TaxID=7222 RepID=B4J5K8_DROGR|nr:general odorant-binding protein 57c [Drosophila grimshawi]EDW00771.1 GH20839 [Drosophila grimshawi]
MPVSVADECLAKNNVTREDFLLRIDQSLAETHEENIEINYMCFVHCMATELNVLDANGRIDIELLQIVENLRDTNIEVVEECNRVNNSVEDLCIYAFEMLLCLIKNIDNTQYINIAPERADY